MASDPIPTLGLSSPAAQLGNCPRTAQSPRCPSRRVSPSQMQRLAFALGVGVNLSITSLLSAEPISVFQGAGEWTNFQLGQVKEQHRVAFTAYCSDVNALGWLIDLDYGTPYVRKFVSGTDGSNIVTVAYYKPQYTNAAGYSIIEKATIPRGDGFLPLSAIWIAVCAPPYLDGLTTNRISPPYFKDGDRHSPGHYPEVDFFVERTQGMPGYVNRMRFMHDGNAVSIRGERMKVPAPFDKGFTNAVFSTTRFARTNQVGGQYPEEFTLDYFYIFSDSKKGGEWRLYLSQSCRLWITNAFKTNIANRLFPPALNRASFNMDYRFVAPNSPSMVVRYERDKYLLTEQVEALPQFRQALLRQGSATLQTASLANRIRAVGLGVIVLLFSSLFGILGWIWVRHPK
jgi:hypothetical protein